MNDLETAVYGTLSTNAGLLTAVSTRIFNTVVPRGAALPACVFSMQSGLEENVSPRRSQRIVLLVKGIARSKASAAQIADAAMAALRDVELSVTGWGWFWTMPLSYIAFAEPDPAQVSEMLWHCGWECVIRLAK
jgi:hypothetical protein